MTTISKERLVLIDNLVCDAGRGSSYWANITFEGNNIIVEDFEGGNDYTLTYRAISAALTGWAKERIKTGGRYTVNFIKAVNRGDYDNADYDANLADEIIQHACFGHQEYA